MLKNFSWKTILLTLFAWMLFWEVKETITGERMFFFYRWLYSDKAYAKNIETFTYLLTDEQVIYMLSHPNEPVQQPTRKELRLKNLNAVLRLRNLKGGIAYGTLKWGILDEGWSMIDIDYIPTPSDSAKYANVIIPLGMIIAERTDGLPDPIIVEWEKFYVYR